MKNWAYILFFVSCLGTAQQTPMKLVKGGEFKPQYGAVKNQYVRIKNFYMDVTPVTHKQFLEFLKADSQWTKNNVKRLFAEKEYLKDWDGDFSVPAALEDAPVVNVSWYAAKAYCGYYHKRLPTTNEWEYAAMADATKKDARKDSLFNAEIIQSYGKRNSQLQKVGKTKANYWGIKDLNRLVWEWTSDFNSVMMTGDSRNNKDSNLFCGAGSLSSNDLMDYAAYMRYAMRSSIQANYTVSNLGFRCVKD